MSLEQIEITLTIDLPGKPQHKMRVSGPPGATSNETILGLIDQLKIWAEDSYPASELENDAA